MFRLTLILFAGCIVPPAGWSPPQQAAPESSSEEEVEPPHTSDGDAQSECKSAYGTTACGYGCVAEYGVVKCAQRPGGTCQAAYGEVTCSEGGGGYHHHHHHGYTAQSECKSDYGTTACGYGCASGYGEVKCSQHPGGQCQAAYGSVTCN